MNIDKKIKISIILFLVAFLAICFCLVYPLVKDVQGAAKELESQKENFVVLETKIENLEDFKVVYKGLEEILGRIDGLFVDSDVPVDFINFLETTAENSSLEFEMSSAAYQDKKKDNWPFILFQAKAEGMFPSLLIFLDKLESSPYLIEVKDINISEMTEGNVNSTFSIKVYAK